VSPFRTRAHPNRARPRSTVPCEKTMLSLPPGEPRWTLQSAPWRDAVERLRSGRTTGVLDAALLTPVVDHFECAWGFLRHLAVVAESFAPQPDQPPLSVHYLAEFILDDVVDVFRGAASEVMRLIPAEHAWASEPSPSDVLDEGRRFQRLLVVAGLAAGSTGARDMLSVTTQNVAEALTRWSDELAPLIETRGHGAGGEPLQRWRGIRGRARDRTPALRAPPQIRTTATSTTIRGRRESEFRN
jgi:hypothetical protein